MMIGVRRQGSILYVTSVLRRERPPVSVIESFVYHGWVVPGTDKRQIALSDASSALVFLPHPHILPDEAGHRLRNTFMQGTPVDVLFYKKQELLDLFNAHPSRILSGKEHSSVAAQDLIHSAGLTPVRQDRCFRIDLDNLASRSTAEGVQVGRGDGGWTRRVVLDEERIAARRTYHCFGLCIPDRAVQGTVIAAIRDNSKMYYMERLRRKSR